MRVIKLKNNTVSADYWIGVQILPGEYYQLQNSQDLDLAIISQKVNQDIWSGNLVINDGNSDLTMVGGDAWLKGVDNAPKNADGSLITTINSSPAFGAKTITVNGVVKKLFARFSGIQQALTVGDNVITYTIIYPWVKMIGIEVINCEALDIASLKIYDDGAGTYSGIPNLCLNQFSYSISLPKDYYVKTAQFDADVYVGMVIKIEYNSISNKTIGINFTINEVKI